MHTYFNVKCLTLLCNILKNVSLVLFPLAGRQEIPLCNCVSVPPFCLKHTAAAPSSILAKLFFTAVLTFDVTKRDQQISDMSKEQCVYK